MGVRADGNPDGRAQVSDHFTHVAAAYIELWAPVLMPANRALLAELPLARARAVLDIGSGVGSLHPAFVAAAPAARVVLTDRSAGMIALAPATADRVVCDADRLPFRAETFDVATMAFMLQYVDDPVRTMREVARVLRPGGGVGVLVWGDVVVSYAGQLWLDALDDAGAAPAPPLATYYEALSTPDRLRAAAAGAGLEQARVWDVPWVDHPDVETFVRRQQLIGTSGRRFATLAADEQQDFLASLRPRLAALPTSAFRDTSQVLALVATRAS